MKPNKAQQEFEEWQAGQQARDEYNAQMISNLESTFTKLGVLVEVSNGLGLMSNKEAKQCKEILKQNK